MTFSRLMEVSVLLPSVKSLPFHLVLKVRFVSVPACTSDRPDIVYLPAPSTVMFLLNLTSSVTSDSKGDCVPLLLNFLQQLLRFRILCRLFRLRYFPLALRQERLSGNKHAATNKLNIIVKILFFIIIILPRKFIIVYIVS